MRGLNQVEAVCLYTSTDGSCVIPTFNLNFVETRKKDYYCWYKFVVNLTFEFFSIGYACGFIGLFFFFFSFQFVLLFCLGYFFAGSTHPDLVPFAKYTPVPHHRWGHLPQSRPPSARQTPSRWLWWRQGPRAHCPRPLLFTFSPGQAACPILVGPCDMATGRALGPALGGGCHHSLLPLGLQGKPDPAVGGRQGSCFLFFFFLFFPLFFFVLLAAHSQKARTIWTGESAGGSGETDVPDSTGNKWFSRTAPTRASWILWASCAAAEHSPRLCARPQNRGVCGRSFVKEKKIFFNVAKSKKKKRKRRCRQCEV